MAVAAALDIECKQCQISKSNLFNLPLQKIHWSLAAGSGRNFRPAQLTHSQCLLLWIPNAKYQNGISATCRCRRSIGALLLALAIFPACPALHSIHGCCCCSGFQRPTQCRVSKRNLCSLPLQKIHWSLAAGSGRNFRPAQLSTLFNAALAALDTSCQVSKRNLCNLPVLKVHWSLAAGSGRNFRPSKLCTPYMSVVAALDI